MRVPIRSENKLFWDKRDYLKAVVNLIPLCLVVDRLGLSQVLKKKENQLTSSLAFSVIRGL